MPPPAWIVNLPESPSLAMTFWTSRTDVETTVVDRRTM